MYRKKEKQGVYSDIPDLLKKPGAPKNRLRHIPKMFQAAERKFFTEGQGFVSDTDPYTRMHNKSIEIATYLSYEIENFV